jgi:hypothetical protein
MNAYGTVWPGRPNSTARLLLATNGVLQLAQRQ